MNMLVHRTHEMMRSQRGFTLVELLLSLTITAFIGAAVAAMLASVSHATNDDTDLRRVSLKQAVVSQRLDAALRSCKMVLADDMGMLVLWMGDSRPNGQPDLSEIRRIQWDDPTGELWSYAAPADLTPASDASYRLSNDFDSITWSLMGTSVFPGRLWATNVTELTISLDDPTPQHASMVQYALAVSSGELTSSGAHTVSFRSR